MLLLLKLLLKEAIWRFYSLWLELFWTPSKAATRTCKSGFKMPHPLSAATGTYTSGFLRRHLRGHARNQHAEYYQKVCAIAAKGGHLEVLQWLRSQGCAFDRCHDIFRNSTTTNPAISLAALISGALVFNLTNSTLMWDNGVAATYAAYGGNAASATINKAWLALNGGTAVATNFAVNALTTA